MYEKAESKLHLNLKVYFLSEVLICRNVNVTSKCLLLCLNLCAYEQILIYFKYEINQSMKFITIQFYDVPLEQVTVGG